MALTPQGKVAGWSLFIGVPVALFLAGVGVGRWSKRCPPAEVREVVRTVEVERAAKAAASSERTAVSATRAIHTVTRWIRRPDGTTEVERRRDSDHASLATAAKAETVVEYRDRWHAAEKVETKVTVSPGARWHLQAGAGAVYGWQMLVGGQITYNVAGPFTLSLGLDAVKGERWAPAARVMAGVRW